jgi:hypothetical protein
MALVPISLVFELAFLFLGVILYRENLTLERLVAVALFVFEIPLLVGSQQFFTDASGTLTVTTASIPSTLLGYLVFADFLLIFVALYRWWELRVAMIDANKADKL